MLGRYTPAALECASMTRMQAMRGAAGALELEHLAMALLMASPTLFDWLPAPDVVEVRRVLDPRAPAGDACAIVMSGGTGAGGLPPGPSKALKVVIDRRGAASRNAGCVRAPAGAGIRTSALGAAAVGADVAEGVYRSDAAACREPDVVEHRRRSPRIHLPPHHSRPGDHNGWALRPGPALVPGP